MKILAIDTATLVSSVALVDEHKLLAEMTFNISKTHSEKLLPFIDFILREAGLELADLSAVAVAAGPGSFTGLRIGMATAKALAYGADKIVLGIPTLDALSYNVEASEKLIVPIMNARRNEVYTAIYRRKALGLERLTDYLALTPEQLRLDLLARAEDVLLLGDGVPEFAEIFKEEKFYFAEANNCLNRASSIGKIAMERLLRGEADDYFLLSPAYLRTSQA